MAKKPEKKADKTINKLDEASNLAKTQLAIEKKYGKGSIMFLNDNVIVPCQIISTGDAGINMALGVGGVPRGRVIEIYGPESSGKTTLTLHIIAQAQKAGGRAAFIDAEHALDPSWAKRIGVKLDSLLLSQPDSAEQALDICEMLVRGHAFSVIVLDSVAALIPKAELEGEMGQSHIGLQARLMSQALRKLTGIVAKSNTTVIFINQIREKIGVMFGCLHGDTLLNFVDGRSLPIGLVVSEKIKGEVWSYNVNSKTYEPKPIINWYNNGNVNDSNDYLSITAYGPGNKNGQMAITVTPDHLVMTDAGWTKAADLAIGSKVSTKYDDIMSGSFGQFLSGVLSGDSHIAKQNNAFSASLKLQDNSDFDYTKWKVSKLSDLGFNEHQYSKTKFESRNETALAIHKELYPNRDPMVLLNNFSWLGMAVWLMDDAIYERGRYHLSIKRFRGNFDKIEQISRTLDNLELYHYAGKGGSIIFDKLTSDKIAGCICEFVPPCISRKLPESLRGYYKDFKLNISRIPMATFAVVKNIRPASSRQMRNLGKYDIGVADNCCYLAGGSHNGLLVHNSPETRPGGRALKFYASVIIEIKKTGVVKDGEDAIGSAVKVKVVKNKMAPPFKETTTTIFYGEPVAGFDSATSLFDLAVKHEVFDTSGSFHNFNSVRLGNGKAQASTFIRENPDIAQEIWAAIWAKIGPATIPLPQTDATVVDGENTLDEIDVEVVTPADLARDEILALPPDEVTDELKEILGEEEPEDDVPLE